MSPARSTSARPPRPPVSGRALLLKRTPYGESSLVVHALTVEYGRVELIAKGAHRLKSRYSGVLDWFDTLDLNWTPPRSDGGERVHNRTDFRTESARVGGLGTLRTGDVDVRRRWITSSLETYRAAHTAIELTELATRAGFADTDLFALLESALDEFNAVGRALNVADDGAVGDLLAPLPLRLARFELRLLASLGLQPALSACAACGGPAPAAGPSASPSDGPQGPAQGPAQGVPRAPFSPQAGGRLCAQHAREAHAAGRKVGTLPIDVLEGAHALVDPVDAGRSKALLLEQVGEHPEFGERILDFAGRFLDHQLETRPKSHAEFLGAPDRNSRAKLSSTT